MDSPADSGARSVRPGVRAASDLAVFIAADLPRRRHLLAHLESISTMDASTAAEVVRVYMLRELPLEMLPELVAAGLWPVPDDGIPRRRRIGRIPR